LSPYNRRGLSPIRRAMRPGWKFDTAEPAPIGARQMTTIDRRRFLASVAAGVAAAGRAPLGQSAEQSSALSDPMFHPLPLGTIRPAGWLQRQLRIQADGLSGHLDEFWPDVGQSQWFGGTAEGWERAPYWLDGVIPLAWLIDDEPL